MYVLKVQLPSRGKFGNSHIGLKSLTVDLVRQYLAYEGRHTIAINNLLKEVCDTDLSDYPIGDRDYVFIQLRQMINPTPIEGSWKCQYHKEPFLNSFRKEIKDIKIIQLPDDFQSPSEFTLPISKDKIKMTLLAVAGEEKVEEYLELHKTADSDMMHADLKDDLSTFAMYAVMIVNNKSIEENISYLRSLDFTDFEMIMLYELSFKCGPDLSVDTKCKDCKKPWRIKISIDTGFLGISLRSLLIKHRFLAKTSNIGFNDFLNYTINEVDTVVKKEIEVQNTKKK